MSKALIIGSEGQVGSELRIALIQLHGRDNVIATDHQEIVTTEYRHQPLDATHEQSVRRILIEESIQEVYLMAAMLSATAEKNPLRAWELNMNSLLIVLEAAKDGLVKKVFWPSSIAVFGPDSPKINCPQQLYRNPLRYMASASQPENCGATIIMTSMVSM